MHHDTTPRAKPHLSDAVLLEHLSYAVLRAGLSPGVVHARWAAFQRAFDGFAPEAVAALTEAQIEILAMDPALLRHRGKLRAIASNARIFQRIAGSSGSVRAWLEGLGDGPYERRLETVSQTFDRVGARTAHLFLEAAGLATASDWTALAP